MQSFAKIHLQRISSLLISTVAKNLKTGSAPATFATDSGARSAKTAGIKKTSKRKSTAAKKRTGELARKRSSPVRKQRSTTAREPSEADIRLRAYFIAERRVQLALQGDPARDWIEARQQLLAEARRTSS